MTDHRPSAPRAQLWVLTTLAVLLFAHACEVGWAQPSRQQNSEAGATPWVVYDGFDGPGKGKHVVLISGDEEYRSEEALPQLGKILAKRHGFTCTAFFAYPTYRTQWSYRRCPAALIPP